jgi:hypothetical protein
MEEGEIYSYFMQDSDTVHSANFSLIAVEEVFGEWLITCRCVNNPHSLQELKEDIQRHISDISRWVLSYVKKYL